MTKERIKDHAVTVAVAACLFSATVFVWFILIITRAFHG